MNRHLSEIYQVSLTAIYNWKKKYSGLLKDGQIIVEKILEGKKKIELLKRIRELERVIGKKQLELDFYKTAIRNPKDSNVSSNMTYN